MIPYQDVKLSYLKVVHLVEVEGVQCHGVAVKRVLEWVQRRVLLGCRELVLQEPQGQEEGHPWDEELQWVEVQEEPHRPPPAACLHLLHHQNLNVSNIIMILLNNAKLKDVKPCMQNKHFGRGILHLLPGFSSNILQSGKFRIAQKLLIQYFE